MRPDVSELLASVCRILEDVVAPEIGAPYPQEVLHGVVSTLRALQEGWARVLPFLHWDSSATTALLRRVRERATAPLAAQIDAVLAAAAPDPTDAIAAQVRNQALRALLAQILADDDPACRAACAEPFDDILRHLEDRARRAPIRHIPEMPRSATTPET